MYDHTNPDRKLAILTKKDRRFLLSDGSGYDSDDKYNRKQSIIPRTKNALADFRVLAEYLPEEWRDEIFHAMPYSDEYNQIQRDIASAIQFFYVGLGGQARFRPPLSIGVSNGEVELGNVEYSGQALPRFVVGGHNTSINEREALNLVKSGNWNALESPDLFTFIREARQADAIDFDKIENHIEVFEDIPERENALLTATDTVEYGNKLINFAMKMWALAEHNPDAFEEFLDETL